MSFETTSLLLNWMEMGALQSSFGFLAPELIANTQRELRGAIYHLGERRAREPSNNNRFGGPRTTLVSRSRWVPADRGHVMYGDDLARRLP